VQYPCCVDPRYKELFSQTNVYLHHTLKEGNQSGDFFTKFRVFSDVDFLIHASAPKGIHDLWNDAIETFYSLE
jgi:hypothetical protein